MHRFGNKGLALTLALVGWAVMMPTPAAARGGGGCLERGTPVLTPSGPVPVEQLKPGDGLVSGAGDPRVEATVQAVTAVEPDAYCELKVAGRVLRLTGEHPVETAPGVFRMAKVLRAGDVIRIRNRSAVSDARIESTRALPARAPAYNLLVSPGGTYVADGVVVHNKGCFLPDTRIRAEDGSEIAISEVREGDRLLAFTAEGAVTGAVVRKILSHEVGEYRIVRTGSVELRVTPEHPFYVGDGTFKTLEALAIGDSIYVFDGKGLGVQRIESIEAVATNARVYNLQADPPNTFFANGVAVHNKGGGCFARGTRIRTPGGDIPIERIRLGDAVTAIDRRGRPVTVRVTETHVTRSPLVILSTAAGSLRTTAEHPLDLAAGDFRAAGELGAGEKVRRWDNGTLTGAEIASCEASDAEEEVFNLTVDAPHTFIADGFVVHNKGGGGFHGGSYHGSRSSGGGSSGDGAWLFPAIIFLWVFFKILAFAGHQTENLDFVFSPGEIARKSKKTLQLLEFIAKQDPALAPAALVQQAKTTFVKLQECWQAREYGPMQPLLMPDLYRDHCGQIQGMIRNHEIDRIEDCRIDRVDLVNVRYTEKEARREFTALITATARDYYVDDRTQSFLRGDRVPAQFQEFWTFQRLNGAWLLREIEQTRESSALKEDNFFEAFTENGVRQVYGKEADAEGPSGNWLEKGVAARETRVERLLNFLVQTDKLWNATAMTETTRRVFLELMAAWESGNAGDIPAEDIFPDAASHLAGETAANRERGITREFRNLCVRKVELILVRNFTDNTKDEFVARVRAHAQRVVRRRGQVTQQDEDVTPFEQYLTMGRLDQRWKLKEILPADAGQAALSQENLDQDSNPDQLKWYYQHKRAV